MKGFYIISEFYGLIVKPGGFNSLFRVTYLLITKIVQY